MEKRSVIFYQLLHLMLVMWMLRNAETCAMNLALLLLRTSPLNISGLVSQLFYLFFSKKRCQRERLLLAPGGKLSLDLYLRVAEREKKAKRGELRVEQQAVQRPLRSWHLLCLSHNYNACTCWLLCCKIFRQSPS